MTKTQELSHAADRFGAQMVRPSIIPGTAPAEKVTLRKIAISRSGYDRGGAYWGLRPPGMRLYRCSTPDQQLDVFVDAAGRPDAIGKLRQIVPGIRFRRH
jgi:hypothetical protein